MTETISLVVTTYNRERYLSAAIESVLAQTQDDFELLIWDDGSTDGSIEIANQYALRDRRIRVVAAPHQGRVKSLQNAIAQTSGKYVGLLDSDDLLAPTALEETMAVLEAHPEAGFVYTDYLDIDPDGQVLGYGHRCSLPYSQDGLLLNFMTFHFRLIRRSILEAVGGFHESYPCAQDYDLCLRLSEAAEVKHISRPLYYYRTHPETISHQQSLEQIQCSHKAIAAALERRGLADLLELKLQVKQVGQRFQSLSSLKLKTKALKLAGKKLVQTFAALPLLGAVGFNLLTAFSASANFELVDRIIVSYPNDPPPGYNYCGAAPGGSYYCLYRWVEDPLPDPGNPTDPPQPEEKPEDEDKDKDGLKDKLENSLMEEFFPRTVYYAKGEKCSAPATSSTPGTVLARIRKHPTNPSNIAITYVILYQKDCGAGGHNGDVEPMTITLTPNPSCSNGYGAFAVKTVGHEGTLNQSINQKTLSNACNWGQSADGFIYVAENKHANYLAKDLCGRGGFFFGLFNFDRCDDKGIRPAFQIFNVGEDTDKDTRFIDALDAYGFPGEFAWTAKRFTGGLSTGRGNAGFIRDKFLKDSLLPDLTR
jgi:glycosyltransferase involved in cell wall biosynthesis